MKDSAINILPSNRAEGFEPFVETLTARRWDTTNRRLPMKAIQGIRRRWLRFMQLYTILGAGGFGIALLVIPEMVKMCFQSPTDEPVPLSVVGSVFLAFGFVSVLGFRDPFKLVPLLFLQLWFVLTAIPLLITGRFQGYALLLTVISGSYVVGDLIAIPFSYLFKNLRRQILLKSPREPDPR